MGLLTKYIEISVTPNIIKKYEKLGYIIPKYKNEKGELKYKLGETIYINVNDLSKNSNKKVKVKCDICGKEQIITYTSYNDTITNNNGIYYCKKCKYEEIKSIQIEHMKKTYKNKQYKSKNKFELSNDKTYWIGYTQKEEKFYFNGDDDVIKYIKQFTWRINSNGYLQNRLGEKLHRVVMKITDPNIFVNHVGGNKYDCRKEKLSISDCKDNSKEKKINNRNTSGITGLSKRRSKWCGFLRINGININTKYKEKYEATIDLLIAQRHYGFRHNENKYYLLEDISEERIQEVIDNCERQLNKKINHKICSKNKFELSKDGTYYNVYDKNNKSFKIDIKDKDLVENGIWYVAEDINHNKKYVHGNIIQNGVRKTVKLHRYLFNLLDLKYKLWFIDHLNGDGLDNRRNNMIITDAQGNRINKPIKGYSKRYNKFRIHIQIFGNSIRKTVNTEEEAIDLVNNIRKEAMKNRIQFKTKEELDEYLNNGE